MNRNKTNHAVKTLRGKEKEQEKGSERAGGIMRPMLAVSEQVGEMGDLDETSIVCGLIGHLNAAR